LGERAAVHFLLTFFGGFGVLTTTSGVTVGVTLSLAILVVSAMAFRTSPGELFEATTEMRMIAATMATISRTIGPALLGFSAAASQLRNLVMWSSLRMWEAVEIPALLIKIYSAPFRGKNQV